MENGWTLDIKNQAWTEDTEHQVDFIMRAMNLTGGETVLDLACGYGRHALALARRGFTVTGVDVTPAFIEDARRTAADEGLSARFILADLCDMRYANEFDVVLSLADGAIGYFDTDAENLKIFDVIAAALKPGGKHFMDVCSAEHAARHFPKHHWLAGKKELSLSAFTWDAATRCMCFSGCQLPYGSPAAPPVLECGGPIRLYTAAELKAILAARGMRVQGTYADYDGTPASPEHLQLMVYSRKGT